MNFQQADVPAWKERLFAIPFEDRNGSRQPAIAFQIAWKLYHARWNLRHGVKHTPETHFNIPSLLSHPLQ